MPRRRSLCGKRWSRAQILGFKGLGLGLWELSLLRDHLKFVSVCSMLLFAVVAGGVLLQYATFRCVVAEVFDFVVVA